MKIAVFIKQVPTREWQPRLNDAKTWVRAQDVSYEMNEPDAYALEEALRAREKPRGADRAIHVEHDSLGAADAFVIAEALAAAMKDEKFDLVLTGLQSDDQGHGQTGVILPERLGIPSSTIIIGVQIEGGTPGGQRER